MVITPKASVNTPAVDAAVASMKADGTFAKLSTAYLTPLFGSDPATIPVWSLN